PEIKHLSPAAVQAVAHIKRNGGTIQHAMALGHVHDAHGQYRAKYIQDAWDKIPDLSRGKSPVNVHSEYRNNGETSLRSKLNDASDADLMAAARQAGVGSSARGKGRDDIVDSIVDAAVSRHRNAQAAID